MNILYFYSQMVPSWIPVFKELVKLGHSITVVHWDHKKKTPYYVPTIKGVNFLNRSDFDFQSLLSLYFEVDPDLIFVSGWMDLDYLKVTRLARKNEVPVIFGCDDWWLGTFRQRMASLLPKFIKNSFISHAWVAGPKQYEYCKRLGFSDSEIIHNLLSCDVQNFSKISKISKNNNTAFLFVGRFSEEKGIRCLVEAYQIYKNTMDGKWDLTCVGNGPLDHLLLEVDCIDVIQFVDQRELCNLMSKSSVFVLPSLKDFSPLVVHEAVSAGMPLILSDMVGNGDTYSIENFNSLMFRAGDPYALACCFKQFESFSMSTLERMSVNSVSLSARNSPKITASSLLSVIRAV